MERPEWFDFMTLADAMGGSLESQEMYARVQYIEAMELYANTLEEDLHDALRQIEEFQGRL